MGRAALCYTGTDVYAYASRSNANRYISENCTLFSIRI